jgi:hypothetical protein
MLFDPCRQTDLDSLSALLAAGNVREVHDMLEDRPQDWTFQPQPHSSPWVRATRCASERRGFGGAGDRGRHRGLLSGEIKLFFLHQANLHPITAVREKLGIPADLAPITVDRLGDTGSAGVFTALHRSFERGLVRPGDTYVVSAIGAGFQWGSLCFRRA